MLKYFYLLNASYAVSVIVCAPVALKNGNIACGVIVIACLLGLLVLNFENYRINCLYDKHIKALIIQSVVTFLSVVAMYVIYLIA